MVEEPGVLHLTFVIIDVFFVEGPADALCSAALELAST